MTPQAPTPADGTNPAREKAIYRVTLFGSICNFLLLVFKFAAGVLGHSAAMVADAVHSLSDFATDVVVLVFVKLSSKPSDEKHDYGHGKYETLATAIIALCLFVVGAGIFRSAVKDIWGYLHGATLDSPGRIAFWAAILSIAVKEFLYRITVRTGRKVESKVVVANAWHHRSDALSSIGTALGIGCAVFLGEKARVLDPAAALVVSVFIVLVAFKLIRPSIAELLEESLPEEEENEIRRIIDSHPEVRNHHRLRTRRIGHYHAIDLHVLVDPHLNVVEAHRITDELEHSLREELGVSTLINIHIEPYSAEKDRSTPEGSPGAADKLAGTADGEQPAQAEGERPNETR